MGTLYECLKEARLEKYYPTLRVNGITKSEALARLTPQDCAAIGITSHEDRRRLVELINIIKSVHTTEPSNLSAARPNSHNPSPRKRNRSPLVSGNRGRGDQALHAVSDVRVHERPINPPSQTSRAELLRLLASSESDSSSDSSDHSDYEPATKHLNAASSPPRVRRSVVNRIKQKGYNYGVPSNAPNTPTNSKSRSRTSHSRTSHSSAIERIKVCVRKRPRNKREIKNTDDDIAKAESDTTLTVNEPKSAVDLRAYTLQHEFIFDEVFNEKCSNEDVYIRATRPLINCVFEGGTASCFAYGQTGAGKTHTMMGNQEVPGQYLLAAHDIYSIIDSKQYGSGLKVWVSFFEIYCGQLFDLLNKRNRLQAREDGSNRVCIAGLTETECKDVQALMQVIDYGNNARSKGATGVNPDSSRSHAVLQLEVRNSSDKRVGRISFIDLAGSERASDVTDTDRQTRLEGAEINQSLLALKECIRSIDQESKHKPFRQSKLTHILKESFTGNSKTCMIANISPTKSSCEHTLNTLRYADRVKELRKQGIPAGSRSSVSSSLLLNIPPSGGPSVFHPNNILCSSTPVRHKTTRHTGSHRGADRGSDRDNRGSERDFHLDPNETPIKGLGVKRKTVNKSATKPAQPKPTPSVPTRTSVVRHVARSSSSQSESDHIDSDSCNIDTNAKTVKPATASGQNVPVIKSTDTENDFPTTDFNNEEELNDLNRSSGKYGTLQVSSANNPTSGSALKLSTAGHPLPVVDWSSHGAIPKYTGSQSSQVSSSSVAPVLRQKVYKDPGEQETNEPYVSNDLSQKKSGPGNNITPAGNNLSQPKTDTKSSSAAVTTPRLSDSSPQHHNQFQPVLSESFEDDMLFDKPSFQSSISQRIQRTPSNGDNGLNNLGLSRGREVQLKTPQDPSVHPILPAVMPAKSSDLTTFSQRSPARFKSHFEQPDLEPPPFQLALVNPTESRPKIARTPPLILTQSHAESQGFHRPNVDISSILEGVNEHRRLQLDMEANAQKIHGEHNPQIERKNSRPDRNESPSEQLPLDISPLSTNQWYQTPADFAVHIATSIQKSVNISTDQHSDYEDTQKPERNNNKYDKYNFAPSEENSPFFRPVAQEFEETGLKTVEDNLSEFLPIQKRPGNHDKPAQSLSVAHKDVASRLKSAFSKNEPNNTRSKPAQNNLSGHSDSGLATTVSSDNTHIGSPKMLNNHHSKPKPKENSALSDSDLYKNARDSLHHVKKGRQPNSRSPVSDRSTGSTGSKTPVSQRNVYSPVNQRNVYSPVNQRNVNSPVGSSRSVNNVIKTEKLNNGSAFSPIHPQPVTSTALSKTTVGHSHKDIVHPKPVLSPSSSDPRSVDTESPSLRQRLISSHEDQLASVTSLCKQEMKLLLGAKAGQKTFDEYIMRVSGILSQKMSAIRLLQEQIDGYVASKLQDEEIS
ncbi:uncharacterized protein LOC127736191 [Mytilus californianus]|uniref:uncharacterized protein LOC127736191 n=1 Tax=Mytilus californianus TaxID=6549 RepID=UPI0022454C0F|nr:uncharacterized protein LOC127736191 [Mytilus californianus]